MADPLPTLVVSHPSGERLSAMRNKPGSWIVVLGESAVGHVHELEQGFRAEVHSDTALYERLLPALRWIGSRYDAPPARKPRPQQFAPAEPVYDAPQKDRRRRVSDESSPRKRRRA